MKVLFDIPSCCAGGGGRGGERGLRRQAQGGSTHTEGGCDPGGTAAVSGGSEAVQGPGPRQRVETGRPMSGDSALPGAHGGVHGE